MMAPTQRSVRSIDGGEGGVLCDHSQQPTQRSVADGVAGVELSSYPTFGRQKDQVGVVMLDLGVVLPNVRTDTSGQLAL